jgi:hypothetical protein
LGYQIGNYGVFGICGFDCVFKKLHGVVMEIQSLDQSGIDLIIGFEGCVLHPYLDQTRTPTIGIGMTYYPSTGKKVTMADKPLTKDQAYSEFLLLVKPFELGYIPPQGMI